MGLAAAYRTKFIKQELIKRNQIRRGDILIGKYKSKRTGEVTNKVSFVLDWVPFKGNIAERKLYVFDLDKLHPSILKKLIKKVGGLEFTNTGTFTYHRAKIGMKPRDGTIMFNKYIRDFLQEVQGVWKTYNLINYKQVKLCDYDYSGMFKDLPPRLTIEDKLVKLEKLLTVDRKVLKNGSQTDKNLESGMAYYGNTKPRVTYDEIIQEAEYSIEANYGYEDDKSSGKTYWVGKKRQAMLDYDKQRQVLISRRAKGDIV